MLENGSSPNSDWVASAAERFEGPLLRYEQGVPTPELWIGWSLPRSFDKILAQASDPFIGFHSGLFEERQCSFAGADGLQVAERIHDELQRGSFLH